MTLLRASDVRRGNLPNRLQIPAVVLPSLLLAAMVVTAISTEWRLIPESQQERAGLVQTQSVNVVSDSALEQAGIDSPEERRQVQQAGIADLLISDFVLPFEVASVLLLAALIGALALARGREGA